MLSSALLLQEDEELSQRTGREKKPRVECGKNSHDQTTRPLQPGTLHPTRPTRPLGLGFRF